MSGMSHRNLPVWLENNYIFRKLFIIRKVFLTNRRFNHYSGAAEDVSISKLFPKKYKGIFVDVGCYHPVKYSNTWSLYKKGWRGINVDIDSIKIEMFDFVRSKDINVQCAVTNKTGIVKYYKHGYFSQVNSLDESSNVEGCRVEEVACRKLTSVIDDTIYKDKKIDLLSVDAEGHDLEVLQSLDFTRYAPSVVIVEINSKIFQEIEQSDLYKYLLSLDYSLVGWCGVSLILVSKEFQQTLKS